MKILHIFLLFLTFGFFACESPQTEAEKPAIVEKKTVQPEEQAIIPELKKNGTEKWIVNEATHDGMLKMSNTITYFSSIPVNSRNYPNLGEALDKKTQVIIEKCDMVGPDHDALHVILYPMLETITKLKESGNVEDFKYMKKLVETYFEYFKTINSEEEKEK